MLLLVTGASGMGKSTVRRLVTPEFSGQLECAELAEVAGPPEWTLRWRHQAVETAVQRAVQAHRRGLHFLLCGDPVPPAAVYAAPSANQLDRVAICLLDAEEEAQRRRLLQRGDDPALLPNHVAFAAWMREHVSNPTHRLDVVQQGGWEAMRWERLQSSMDSLRFGTAHRIDTTTLQPPEVARLVAAWIRDRMVEG